MAIDSKQSARRDTGNGPRRQLLTRAAKSSTPPVYKTTKPPTKKLRRKPKKKSQTDSSASVGVDRAGDQLKKRIHLLEKHKPAITLTGGDHPHDKFPDDVVVNSMNSGYPSLRPFSSGMEILHVHHNKVDIENPPVTPTLQNCILRQDGAMSPVFLQCEDCTVSDPNGTRVQPPRGKTLPQLKTGVRGKSLSNFQKEGGISPESQGENASTEDDDDDDNDDDSNSDDVSVDLLCENQKSQNESQQEEKSVSGSQESQSEYQKSHYTVNSHEERSSWQSSHFANPNTILPLIKNLAAFVVGNKPVKSICVNNNLDKGGCASTTISAILSVTHCVTERAPADKEFEPAQNLFHAVNNAITLGFNVVDGLKNAKDNNPEDIRSSCEACLSVIDKMEGKNNWIPKITSHCYDDMFQEDFLEKILDPIIAQDVGSIGKFFHVSCNH